MARLIARADGNFATLSTWSVVSANSILDAENQASSPQSHATNYDYSQTFTPGAVEVDAVALRLSDQAGTVGTVTCQLYNHTDSAEVAAVTINLTDLPAGAIGNGGGWVLFKFTPVTLIDAKAYKIGLHRSVGSSGVLFYRDGTALNWARMLRTTAAPGSLAAGDTFDIMEEKTGAGAATPRTVTMDNTATTDFGSGTDNTVALTISDGGTLSYGTAASTNYYLKLSGNLVVYNGGTLNIGTVGTPIPATSTAVLEFDPVADGGMGLKVYGATGTVAGTFTAQGASKTISAMLAANKGGLCSTAGTTVTRKEGTGFTGKTGTITINGTNYTISSVTNDNVLELTGSAGTQTNVSFILHSENTALTTDVTTDWVDNDEIGVASTSRTASHCEKIQVASSSGTAVNLDTGGASNGGLKWGHMGTGAIAGEVINITRNVKIRSATSTLMIYLYFYATSVVDIDYVEFYYLGTATAGKRGIEIATTTGTCSIQYSSFHDSEAYAVYVVSASGSGITFSYNVTWNTSTAQSFGYCAVYITASTGVSTISNNILMYGYAYNAGLLFLGDAGATCTNNRLIGGYGSTQSSGITLNENGGTIGTFSGNIFHSGNGYGLLINNTNVNGTVSALTSWRNFGQGIYLASEVYWSITFDSPVCFGNQYASFAMNSGCTLVRLLSPTFNGDAVFSTANGIDLSTQAAPVRMLVTNGQIGTTVAHTTYDINLGTVYGGNVQIELINTTLASSNEIGMSTHESIRVLSRKHDGSATVHKAFYNRGTITSDQTTRHTASGYSWKLTPTAAGGVRKLVFPGPRICDTFKFAVVANALVTVTAYVYKDSSYNGTARLVMVGGLIGGIATDQVASLTVAHSNWEQLTVTGTPNEDGVIDFYIDCDGSAGNVYVDDVAVTQTGSPSTQSLDIPDIGVPAQFIYAGGITRAPNGAFVIV